jgi:1L-myo-inositol 1-phosphate cytidylyltransferase / CDP-L-myo-inositol myo-inositolphosphotransferase
MGSEKSGRPVAVTFDSGREAARRVAGVAAAARIVHEFAEQGYDPIWLVLPGGGALPPAAMGDVERLSGGAAVRIVDAKARLPEAQGVEVAPAPHLDTRDVLKGTGKASDGPVSRWLNRPVSRAVSALLLRLPGMRPIHATAGTALIAAIMFAALVGGGGVGLIAGGLLFHAASVFDGVDGEIARATFRSSPAGAALDSVVDIATNLLFILGVTINLGEREFPQAVIAGGWGLALFVTGLLAIAHRAAQDEGPINLDLLKESYQRRFPARRLSFLVSFGTIVTSRDFFALLFALLILAGLPMAVLYIFAAAATVWIPLVVATLVPTRHQRSA